MSRRTPRDFGSCGRPIHNASASNAVCTSHSSAAADTRRCCPTGSSLRRLDEMCESDGACVTLLHSPRPTFNRPKRHSDVLQGWSWDEQAAVQWPSRCLSPGLRMLQAGSVMDARRAVPVSWSAEGPSRTVRYRGRGRFRRRRDRAKWWPPDPPIPTPHLRRH